MKFRKLVSGFVVALLAVLMIVAVPTKAAADDCQGMLVQLALRAAEAAQLAEQCDWYMGLAESTRDLLDMGTPDPDGALADLLFHEEQLAAFYGGRASYVADDVEAMSHAMAAQCY